MIAVLTDSTCDLPPAALREQGVQMLPLGVHLRGQVLRDWEEVDPDAVYRALESGQSVSTAPVTVQVFEDRYRQLLDTPGCEGIVSLHLSGRISQTAAAAREAARNLRAEDRVRVVDSEVASVLLASAVLAAQRAAQRGADLSGTEQAARRTLQQQYGEFTVPSLEYLRRGGRISAVQQLMGNLLGVRPVVTFDGGELKAVRRVKAEQATGDLLAQLHERFGRTPVRVAVGLAGRDPYRLHELRGAMQRSGLNIRAGRTQLIGSVIGAHTGPGMYAFVAEPFVD